MSDLNQQKQTYRKKYLEFIESSNDGSIDEDISYFKVNWEFLSLDEQRNIAEQIQTWESSPERSGPEAQVKEKTKRKILKDITARLGIPTNLKDAANKFKSNTIKKLKQAIPSPGIIIGRVFNPRRPREGAKIDPENFNKINKSIVISNDDLPKIYQKDNGKKHLIVFHVENNNTVLVFRMANFTGFTDSINPTFQDFKYVGRAEPYYQYTGVTRNVSFSFDVVVHNREDVGVIYNKVNTLISLAYPHKYTETKMIEPNIVKLTIADYLVKAPLFMTGIQITPSDEVTFQESKPSILTINVQGNILQNEEYPIFDSSNKPSYVNNRQRLLDSEAEAERLRQQERISRFQSSVKSKLDRETNDSFNRNIIIPTSRNKGGQNGIVEVLELEKIKFL